MGCQSSCFAPEEVPPNPERIDLSHFELLKVVGKGGFGKVNAITRKFDNQLMALKRMCLARGTLVAFGDGSIRPVEDVRVGDQLMGEDGRRVRCTETMEGRARHMYTIQQQHNDKEYTVTPEHRVTLRCLVSPTVEIESTPPFDAHHTTLTSTAAIPSTPSHIKIRWFDKTSLSLQSHTIPCFISSSSSHSPPSVSSFDVTDVSGLVPTFLDPSSARVHGWDWLSTQICQGSSHPLWHGDLFELSASNLYQRWSELILSKEMGSSPIVEGRNTQIAPNKMLSLTPTDMRETNEIPTPHHTLSTPYSPTQLNSIWHDDPTRVAYILHSEHADDDANDRESLIRSIDSTHQLLQRLHGTLLLPSSPLPSVSSSTPPTPSSPSLFASSSNVELVDLLTTLLDSGASNIVLLGSFSHTDLIHTILSTSLATRISSSSVTSSFTSEGHLRTCFEYLGQRTITLFHTHHISTGRTQHIIRTIAFAHGCTPPSIDCERTICDVDGIRLLNMYLVSSPNQPYVSIEVDGNHRFALAGGTLTHNSKCEVIKKESHIKMVWTERNIMSKLSESSNPFLVSLEHAFQNEKELFFAMEFMQGGDLRFHLTKRGVMTEAECRFYAAEMILALESMHRQKIIYRDFKPDNVLLDSEGHVRLSDFGLAVQLEEKCHYVMKGNAGTGGYLAPEVWGGEFYGISPDIWSFGITVYELLHGRRPYRRWNPTKNYTDKLKFNANLSSAARSFIKGLLTVDPRKRLACGPSGWAEVKSHPFFAKTDWIAIQNKIIKPPIKPDLKQANCSNQADLADQLIDKKPVEIPPHYHKYFTGFDYNVNFGEWLITNEKKKEERLRKAEEAKRLKAEHRQFRKNQLEKMMAAGMTPLSPSSSSGGSEHQYQHGAGGGPGSPHGLQHIPFNHAGGISMFNPDGTLVHPSSGNIGFNMSASGNNSHLTFDHSHMLVDPPADGGLGGGPSATRPRIRVGPHRQQFGSVDGTTPMGSGMQGSWQLSQSDDSNTHESDVQVLPQYSFVGPSGAIINIHPNSNYPSERKLYAHGNTALPPNDPLAIDDAHLLQLTQHAHCAGVYGPCSSFTAGGGANGSFDSRVCGASSSPRTGSFDSRAGGPAFGQSQLPANDGRISAEAEHAIQAFKEFSDNQRRDRLDAKRKAEAKQLKHRTSVSQVLLSVVRAKPTDQAGISITDQPPSEEEKSLTHKFAEILQKDRENIRKIIHGDSVLSADSPEASSISVPFRGNQSPSIEMPGRIRSVLPSQTQLDSSHDSTKGLIPGMGVLGPGGLSGIGTPVFPYSTSTLSTGYSSSVATSSPTHTSSAGGSVVAKMAHTGGIARFTSKPDDAATSDNNSNDSSPTIGPTQPPYAEHTVNRRHTDPRIGELTALHLGNAAVNPYPVSSAGSSSTYNPYANGTPGKNSPHTHSRGGNSSPRTSSASSGASPRGTGGRSSPRGGSGAGGSNNSPRRHSNGQTGSPRTGNANGNGNGSPRGSPPPVIVSSSAQSPNVHTPVASRPQSASSTSATPIVRHRIHVSVAKRPNSSTQPIVMLPAAASGGVVPTGATVDGISFVPSFLPSSAVSTMLLPPAATPNTALLQTTPIGTSQQVQVAIVAPTPVRNNILEQWGHITHTIKKLREQGRKIQICIFLDYDGTLTPIVSVPSAALLSPSVRRSLTSLLPLYPTSILTGRSLQTISSFLIGIDHGGGDHPLHIAASHGFEVLLDGLGKHTSGISTRVKQVGVEFLPTLESFHITLRAALEQHPQLAAHLAAESLALENNRFSLSVHYRNLPAAVGSGLLASLDGVLDTLLARPEFDSLQRFGGKMVYEIKPRIAAPATDGTGSISGWHKGCAMDFLLHNVLFPGQRVTSTIVAHIPRGGGSDSGVIDSMRRITLEDGVELLPIYCGDDVTDEDCFRYMADLGVTSEDTLLLPALSVYVQGSDKSIRPSGAGVSSSSSSAVTGSASSVSSSTVAPSTAANYTLRNTDEVHQLLEKLIEFAQQ